MRSPFPKWLNNFLIWRIKHIPNSQFIYLVSILVGFMSGVIAVIIKNGTHFIELLLEGKLIREYQAAFYFIFPLIGLTLTYLVIKYVVKNPITQGIPATLYAISKQKGMMRRFQMFGGLITAPLTVGFGGSVGLEGPTIATGAAWSSNLARMLRMNQSTRTLLLGCAAAGAMSSMFKAPLAAIIFAVEVFSLDLTLASLLPLLLASLSAIFTSYFFFGNDVLLPFDISEKFELGDIPVYVALGLVSALFSIYFTHTYERMQALFDRIGSPVRKLLFGGIGIGLLIYLIPPLYGEGFDVINSLVQGDPGQALENNIFQLDLENTWIVVALLAGLVIFKIVASTLTFGAGGVGGIFSPTLFMGSIMGYCLARIINALEWIPIKVSESNLTLVGMTGLMAGVLHAPLTAIFLIAEVTGGYELFIPLMLTAAISYTITKHYVPHSVYAMELGRKGELITHDKDHAVLTLMELKQVIETDFAAVRPDMTLGQIIEKAVMRSNRNIFPVVDEKDGTLTGIILLDQLRPVMFDRSLYIELTAQELMRTPIAVINLDQDTAGTVMKKFESTRAWNLPVIQNGLYIGFVSKSKLLTAYRKKLIDVSTA